MLIGAFTVPAKTECRRGSSLALSPPDPRALSGSSASGVSGISATFIPSDLPVHGAFSRLYQAATEGSVEGSDGSAHDSGLQMPTEKLHVFQHELLYAAANKEERVGYSTGVDEEDGFAADAFSNNS